MSHSAPRIRLSTREHTGAGRCAANKCETLLRGGGPTNLRCECTASLACQPWQSRAGGINGALFHIQTTLKRHNQLTQRDAEGTRNNNHTTAPGRRTQSNGASKGPSAGTPRRAAANQRRTARGSRRRACLCMRRRCRRGPPNRRAGPLPNAPPLVSPARRIGAAFF